MYLLGSFPHKLEDLPIGTEKITKKKLSIFCLGSQIKHCPHLEASPTPLPGLNWFPSPSITTTRSYILRALASSNVYMASVCIPARQIVSILGLFIMESDCIYCFYLLVKYCYLMVFLRLIHIVRCPFLFLYGIPPCKHVTVYLFVPP